MRRNVNRWLGGAAVVAALLGLGGTAGAQSATSNLRGYVTSTGGAPLSDAQVAARLIASNQTRGTMTNASGFYYMGGLRPGSYEVTVRRIGFEPQTRIVVLRIGETVDLNVATSQVTQQLAAVEVQGVRGGSTSRTSEVGTNITPEQIENLPNFERNVLDYAKLVPGITAQTVNDGNKYFAAGGQPAEAVNIFVDGATYKNDVLKGGVVGQDANRGNPLPQGAIQEFRVLTQNYKAEYQRAASAVIVATTKTGTNRTEGEVFAYGVGKAYVAKDEFAVRRGESRPRYDRLQAGGNIGGPIVKDKLFYFGTYELNFRDEPAYVRLQSDTAFAPAALRQQLLGYTGQFQQQFREHIGLGKLTWLQSERNTIDASLSVRNDNDFRGFGNDRAYESNERMIVDTYTGVANFRHAGDRWLNEAQVNAQTFRWNQGAGNLGLIGKNYEGLLRIGGKEGEQDFTQRRLSLRDDITRGGVQLAGDHVFKFGGSVDFLRYRAVKNNDGNPTFSFHRVATDASANWAQPYKVRIGFGDPVVERNNMQFGAYLQDDWSVGRHLVLNLGIRWDGETNMINNDYVTPQGIADTLRAQYAAGLLVATRNEPTNCCVPANVISTLGGINNFLTTGRNTRPMYKKAFQPRVGASYDLGADGRTVLFGGVGLYYDRNYWNTLFDEQFRRQFAQTELQFNANCGTTTNCAAWDPKYYDPAQLRSLALVAGKPEIFLVKNDLTPPHSYQMSAGIRQAVGINELTVSYNGVRGYNYMNFIRGGPWGGGSTPYNTVFVTDDNVRTWYDALQLQLERPFSSYSRWGGALAYTFGKSTARGVTNDIFWGFDDRYATVSEMPRVRAPGDQRHAIVANGIVRVPFDIVASTIINLGTGVTENGSNESRGSLTGQRFTYTFNPPGRPFLGIGQVFAYQNMDLRLQKDFPLVSGQTASVVFDFFNVLNSHNFGCWNTTINSSNTGYGTPGCAGLGRRFQLGVRYGFAARNEQ